MVTRCSRSLAIFECLLVYGASTVLAALQLRTIDDEFGDSHTGVQPVYFPTHAWYQGANCITCQPELSPNKSLAFGGTWHASLHDAIEEGHGSEVHFSFTGTALSVWCILPNPIPSAATTIYTILSILDGVALTDNFTHISDSSDKFQYNVSIFSIENLSNTVHTFRMVTSSTDPSSSVLFDYATYLSSQDPSRSFPILTKRDDPKKGMKFDLGAILGVVFGALFFVIIIILAVWYHLRWRRRQRLVDSQARTRTNKPPDRFTVDPFILDPPRSMLLRYHDYSPGPSTLSSSSQSQSNPSQTGSSSGGGSRYGPIMALHSQGSASSPVLSPSSSSEVLRSHGAMPRSNPSSPISPISQNSNNNCGSIGQETSNSRSSGRHRNRRHRQHRPRERERIAEMRREVAILRTQHQELIARMEQPHVVDDQNRNHERLPEYTR